MKTTKIKDIKNSIKSKIKKLMPAPLTRVEREINFLKELNVLMSKYQVTLQVSIVGTESKDLLPVIEA